MCFGRFGREGSQRAGGRAAAPHAGAFPAVSALSPHSRPSDRVQECRQRSAPAPRARPSPRPRRPLPPLPCRPCIPGLHADPAGPGGPHGPGAVSPFFNPPRPAAAGTAARAGAAACARVQPPAAARHYMGRPLAAAPTRFLTSHAVAPPQRVVRSGSLSRPEEALQAEPVKPSSANYAQHCTPGPPSPPPPGSACK